MSDDISKIHSSAIIRPGDGLILLTEVHMTPEEVQQYRTAFGARHPGVEVTILTGMRQAVVVRGMDQMTELSTEGLDVSTRSNSETPPPRDPPADPGRWSERGRDGRRRTRQSLPKVEPRMPDAIVTEDGSPMSSSDTDLLEMLEIAAGRRDGWEYRPFKDHEGGLYGDALDEIERLRRWKTEATVALEEVQSEWEAAGKPGVLGQSHVRGMATQIEMLRNESTYWKDCYRASNYAHAELRALIIEWADAHADTSYGFGPRRIDADALLRKAVGQ